MIDKDAAGVVISVNGQVPDGEDLSWLWDVRFEHFEQTQVVAAGDEAGVVESVKAASDIYAPVSGEIVAINEALEDEPELVNNAPYEGGWLFKIAMSEESDLDNLLTADQYQAQIESE